MSGGITHRVVVKNPEGLHLRPADQLVRMAGRYQSNILIGKLSHGQLQPIDSDTSTPNVDDSGIMNVSPGQMLDCKSILSLLTLGAAQGDILTLLVDGPDAFQAVDDISRWFDSGFDESFAATNLT